MAKNFTLADMPPIKEIDRLTFSPGLFEGDGELARHSWKFIAGREKRLEKVARMTLEEQNKYYRSLGYFK